MSPRAAVVDADAAASRALAKLLAAQGCAVERFKTLGRFLDAFQKRRPDIVLIDLHQPGIAGREILRALRSDPENGRIILIALSEKRSKEEAIAAFDSGADEYLEKPVEPALLEARLASLLRRAAKTPEEPELKHAGITVLPESRRCLIGAKAVRLTRLEFDILLMFMENPNRVLTRGILIQSLWKGEGSRGARAVDRHVHALRGKIGPGGRALKTLVGIGYCLEAGPKGGLR